MDTRTPKKPRLMEFFPPFTRTGAIAASRSSAVEDDEYIARLNLTQVEDDSIFFPDGATRADYTNIVVSQKVKNALMNTNISDETLRNAVFTDLIENHHIQFPESSKHWKSEMALRSKLGFSLRYNEADLAHILHELFASTEEKSTSQDGMAAANKASGASSDEQLLPRLLNGLNVTTTSKPDMTVIREESLYFGEFKNNEKYTLDQAAKQCTLYLYALLYFFRARRGMRIKAVFGFFVCGVRCSGYPDSNMYSVGFMRLSAPDRLGDRLLPEFFFVDCEANDVTGIQRLVDFLKNGKTMESTESQKSLIPCNLRIPALLTLPVSLWESPLVVHNRTSAMVFKGNATKMLYLLDQLSPLGPSSINYDSFRTSVESSFQDVSPDSSFYLKISLKDTTMRDFFKSGIFEILRNDEKVFNRLYTTRPTGDSNLGIFLMNDCGTVLHESREFAELSFAALKSKFQHLWQRSIAMSKYYLHGDALPHNMVYHSDSQELFLIDLDEGTHGTKAAKRVVRQDDGVYPYLRYPNYLRAWKNRERYTHLQFVASFLLITESLVAESEVDADSAVGAEVSSGDRAAIRRLRTLAASVNSFLAKNNDVNPLRANDATIDTRVDQLIMQLRNLL